MKKNFLQDVVPASHKRSIRDIPLPKHREGRGKSIQDTSISHSRPAPRRAAAPEPEDAREPETQEQSFESQAALSTPSYRTDEPEEEYEEPTPRKQYGGGNSRSRKGSGKKVFGMFVLIGALVALVLVFGRTRAEVVLNPKSDTYEVDVNMAVNASSSIASQTQITKTQSVTLEATSEQQVERQASGRIKIINNYEEESQDLVKNTRFQTSAGLVYRIKESVTVPGYKMVNGTAVPGTLEVEVYADSAGEEYNIGKTTFTIPGFSGMPQFDKITAESVTEMKGGYIGIKKVVSEDAQDDAYDELKEKLTAEFTSQAIISDTDVVIPDTETVVFGELVDEVNGNSVTLSLTAQATAYSFPRQALMDYIGRAMVVGATAENSFTLNPQALTFTKDSDTVTATGTTEITWLTDIEALKNEIAGKKRSEIVQLMSGHQSVERADIKLKPFWKTKFPSDTAKISVEVTE